jgi:CRP/FNR family transcriptional regulator, cyclic AMP receptor protein
LPTAEIRDLLAVHPFFEGLPGTDLDLIAGCGTNVHFAPGATLFSEGAPADTFYVLRRGRVAVETHAPEQTVIVLATHGGGDVLGWSWIFPPHRWTFDARAVDDTSAIALDGGCLRTKCDDDSGLGYRLMRRFARLMTDHLAATRLQLLDLYGEPGSATSGAQRR